MIPAGSLVLPSMTCTNMAASAYLELHRVCACGTDGVYLPAPCRTSSPSTPARPGCAPSPSATTARRSATRTASSHSTSRSRDGSSTTPTTSGRRPRPCVAEVTARPRHARRRSASRTSARRRWRGVERPGRPLARAIVWQDRRTAATCEALAAAGHLDLVRRRTGLVLDPYFSGTKFAWLLTEGGVDADADLALGTVDSWLVWKLTGGRVHATEPSNASRTMLLRHRRAAVEPRAVRAARRTHRRAARGPPVGRRLRRHRRRRPHRRDPRRPAGCPLRPGLPRAGHGQEHLRHRDRSCSPTSARAVPSRSKACSRRSPGSSATARTRGRLRARGRHLRDRRGGAVAARRARRHRRRRRVGGPGRVGARQRRARPGAGVHRPRLAVVGPVRPRRRARHHPRLDVRAPGPGHARVDGLPDPRRARRHGRRQRASR